MPKSTVYLINVLLVILLLVALVWIGNSVTDWYHSKSHHGYMIYNCPKSINVKNMPWFEIEEKCQIVEHVNGKFFEIDEAEVKERAQDKARTAEYMTHVKILGETSPPQNTYYRIW